MDIQKGLGSACERCNRNQAILPSQANGSISIDDSDLPRRRVEGIHNNTLSRSVVCGKYAKLAGERREMEKNGTDSARQGWILSPVIHLVSPARIVHPRC
jgi:hypothetical protein